LILLLGRELRVEPRTKRGKQRGEFLIEDLSGVL
jgi:hypothetical protein